MRLGEIVNKVPIDYEQAIRRVAYLYNISEEDVLKLTLNKLFIYLEDGTYWKLDDLGIKYTRPKTKEQVENQKERDAQLKAQYKKIRERSGK